jgi:hypothetical protein
MDLYSVKNSVSWNMNLQEMGFYVIKDRQRNWQEDDVMCFIQNVKFYSSVAYWQKTEVTVIITLDMKCVPLDP